MIQAAARCSEQRLTLAVAIKLIQMASFRLRLAAAGLGWPDVGAFPLPRPSDWGGQILTAVAARIRPSACPARPLNRQLVEKPGPRRSKPSPPRPLEAPGNHPWVHREVEAGLSSGFSVTSSSTRSLEAQTASKLLMANRPLLQAPPRAPRARAGGGGRRSLGMKRLSSRKFGDWTSQTRACCRFQRSLHGQRRHTLAEGAPCPAGFVSRSQARLVRMPVRGGGNYRRPKVAAKEKTPNSGGMGGEGGRIHPDVRNPKNLKPWGPILGRLVGKRPRKLACLIQAWPYDLAHFRNGG